MILPIRTGFLLVVMVVADTFGTCQAQVGEMPIPILKNVTVQAASTYDPATLHYSYQYTIQNPATNTGEIWNIKLDIRTEPRRARLSASGLTIPFGTSSIPFSDMLSRREPLGLDPGVSVVPIGQQVPEGWNGGFGKDGYARFSAGSRATKIIPGATMSGFTLISPGTPTIREIQAIPDWVLIVPDHDQVTEDVLEAAAAVERDLPSTTYTLGPSGITDFGSDAHWSLLAADIERAAGLGWITETSLAQALRDQLAFARAALDQEDGTLAKARLQSLLQTMLDSQDSQRNRESYDLVVLNVQRLLIATPDTPIPFEPVYTLLPSRATRAIGTQHTVTAKVVNSADHDAPVPGFRVFVTIVEGPHASRSWRGRTDANDEYSFSYTGTAVGTDHLAWTEELSFKSSEPIQLAALSINLATNLAALLRKYQSYPGAFAEAEVTWTGGADLVVPFFMPPEIQSEGGKTVFITEITENIGTVDAAASTTRYFLSASLPLDPLTARVLGERRVVPLTPETPSEFTTQFQLPTDLAEGVYYLAACADANNEIVELDESNNCSFSQLSTSVSIIVSAQPITNAPPDCSVASPGVDILWPPNHKLHDVTIQGVTDPDGDSVTTAVAGIRQDEPVNGLGDGDTSPDGFGIGTSTARIRAERSGLGNGRVYEITFSASDSQGGTCGGLVSVGVPHDRNDQPVNDGAVYDSTLP